MMTPEAISPGRVLLVPLGPETPGAHAALAAAGFRLLEPDSEEEAMAILPEVACDLILIEGGSPGRALHTLSLLADPLPGGPVPVLVLGGADLGPQAAQRLFDLGAADVFLPPIDPAMLAARALATLRLKRRIDAARELSVRDELTGLYNRRFFFERLDQEIARSRRTGQGLGFLLLDIDRFKKINDTFGHPVGDAVLREVAHVAHSHTRRSDVVARIGGDEFAVLLSGNNLVGAEICARSLQAKLREARLALPEGVAVTVSVGVSAWPNPLVHEPLTDLLQVADAALLQAKARGRDLVLVAGA